MMNPKLQSAPLNWLSLTTAPIELFAHDGSRCGTGSGFFYSDDGENVFFVTNWHVVTGRNATRQNFVRHDWKVPTNAKLRLHSMTERSDAISLSRKSECRITVNDASGDTPRWFEHPRHRSAVDVIVLAVTKAELDTKAIYKTIAKCDLVAAYKECVMDDVFVIGYPWGLDGGDGVLPIYKRGSIASEPSVPQGILPRILIDCRTAKSMSGSPVICSHSGVWMPNGKMDSGSTIGTVDKFLGVYSGRLIERDADGASEPAATEIGQVWRRELIDEIITAKEPGKALSKL